MFVIPLVIFVVAYWKILAVIRRQVKVAARLMRTSNEPIAGTSAATVKGSITASIEQENQRNEVVVKGAVKAGPSERGRVGNQQGSSSLSKAQINVVKTMVYITVCFTVCWMPMYFNIMFKKLTVRQDQISSDT